MTRQKDSEKIEIAKRELFRLSKFRGIHCRWMARFLKKRGWVVFYLEEQYRQCDDQCCWLKLYEYLENQEEKND
jgi:hypothetical protein